MILYGLPILYALFLWWFSTGAILYLDGLHPRTFRWSMGGATLLIAAAVYGLTQTSTDTSIAGAYAGFSIGLVIWGWLEIGYYMGFMMGPRRQGSPAGTGGWQHFLNAAATTLYHELGAVALAAVIAAVTWDMPNKMAFWTFLVLWGMQLSAKLNVFLGVPNVAESFLPEHLSFLRSFMTRKPMNLFFPVAITVSMVLATLLIADAAAARTPFAAVGTTMLASLVVLAIIEHWVLVVPIPVEKLWSWSLQAQPETASASAAAAAADAGSTDPSNEGSLSRRIGQVFVDPGQSPIPPLDNDRFKLDRSAVPNR